MTAPTITRQMVLRRAAEILQANGRTVGTYYDQAQNEDDGVPIENCRMCVMGAVAHATGLDVETLGFSVHPFDPAGKLAIGAGVALLAHLRLASYVRPEDARAGQVVRLIGRWNDTETRTDAQVIAALTDTADALDAQESS